ADYHTAELLPALTVPGQPPPCAHTGHGYRRSSGGQNAIDSTPWFVTSSSSTRPDLVSFCSRLGALTAILVWFFSPWKCACPICWAASLPTRTCCSSSRGWPA